MQYTKPMIDHVFQIRKAVPDHMRGHIKLANPELPNTLAIIYREMHDKLLRERIQQFMTMAGPSWLSLLEKPANQAAPDQVQQVYRGHSRHSPENTPLTSTGAKEKMVIYRGRVVPSSR